MSITSVKPQPLLNNSGGSGTSQTNASVPRPLYASNNSTPSRIKSTGARSSIPLKPTTTLRRPSKTMSYGSQHNLGVVSLPKPRKVTESPPSYTDKSMVSDMSESDISSNNIARLTRHSGFVSRIPVRKTSILNEAIPNNISKDIALASRKSNILQPKSNFVLNSNLSNSRISLPSQSKSSPASRIPILSNKPSTSKPLATKPNPLSNKSANIPIPQIAIPQVKKERSFRLTSTTTNKSQILPDVKKKPSIGYEKKLEYRNSEKSSSSRTLVSFSFEDKEFPKNNKRLNLGPSKSQALSDTRINSSFSKATGVKATLDVKLRRTIPTALSRPEQTNNSILKPLSPGKASSILNPNPGLKPTSSFPYTNKAQTKSGLTNNDILSTSHQAPEKMVEGKTIEPYSSHTIEALKKIHKVMVARGTPGAKARASKLSAIIAARSPPEDSLMTSKEPHKLTDNSNITSTSHYVPCAVPKELSKIPLPPGLKSTPSTKRLSSALQKPQGVSSTSQHTKPEILEDSGPPFTPRDVLRNIGYKLSAFEQSEILQFSEIYYCGSSGSATDPEKKNMTSFSTPEGDLMFKVSDHLAYRYEIHNVLGKGSFGQVVKAFDHKHKKDVAIKIIKSAEKFQRQALTEIGILEALAHHDKDRIYNVLHITGSFRFRRHLCIVTELYGINLYEHIKINQFVGFKPSVVHNYAVQILKCLCLLKANNLVHCDLKPENILLADANSTQIKVIDFGSSCYEDQRIYTYIQSRFYRSPEVVLEMPYGTAIDMWSFGCIIVELLTGYPIFPGESEPELMARIIEVVGLPDISYISKSRRRVSYFDISGNLRTSHRYKKRTPGAKPLSLILKNADELLIDFISKCLQFIPEKRMTPQEALNHPWITGSRSSTSSSIEAESPLFAVNHAQSEAATMDYIHRHPELFQQPIFTYDLANKTVNLQDPSNTMYRY